VVLNSKIGKICDSTNCKRKRGFSGGLADVLGTAR